MCSARSPRRVATPRHLLTRLLKKQGQQRTRMITDKLRSYGAAKRQLMPNVEHRWHKSLNNRAVNSRLPFQKARQGFSGPSAHCSISCRSSPPSEISSSHPGPIASAAHQRSDSKPRPRGKPSVHCLPEKRGVGFTRPIANNTTTPASYWRKSDSTPSHC
ncbi:hypothetical protein NKH64_29875 [Mesorhizobium sp. M0999]|uniref:hypothetical protein n=1 Tax=Mesorhizobium TaxID=68287 RepID=UPI001FD9E679|nr:MULTISPECIES: hypothetical protein [Mesorhizobium]WJI42107.1 hypothetical protein NL534_31940 [Mesorhizobium opportunistum]